MKKLLTLATAICMTLIFVFQPISASASAKTDMTNLLTQYKKKNYKKAKTYNKKLNRYAKEASVAKMSKKMKNAYKKVIETYPLKNDGEFLWGVYFTDMDNDKKAELLLTYGCCEADLKLLVYKYQNGKAVKVAETYGAGHSTFHAYPSRNGIVQLSGHMGYETIYVLTLKDGKIQTKEIGHRTVKKDYFPLRVELKNYVKYGKNYNPYVDYSILK